MANLGRQQISSRQVVNRKQNKNLFEPRKFSAPNRDLNSPSATTDMTGYRQPQSRETIANIRRTLEAGTAQTPAFNHQRSNELTAPRQDNSGTIPIIQPKLTIGRPDDKYEREADRVASQVVQQINTPPSTQSPQESVQRAPEKTLQTKQNTSLIQRSPLVPGLQREAIAGGEASTGLTSAINSARGGGQPLDAGLQQSMGQAMGADFSRVRVHTDGRSDSLNRSIQAKAFTTGQDVFFRQGGYQPGSRGGQELIAHELTHVMQQNEVTTSSSLSLLSQQLLQHNNTENLHKSVDFHLNKETIQRKIGFEFEVGNLVTKMKKNMGSEQKKGKQTISRHEHDYEQLKKGDVMARGRRFEMQIDEGTEDMHLEYVTEAFDEGKAGRESLKKTMEDIQKVGKEVRTKIAKSSIKVNYGDSTNKAIVTNQVKGGITGFPETLISNESNQDIAPQTTAGIRLDKLPSLIDNMKLQQNETKKQSDSRGLMFGGSNRLDTETMKNCVSKVRHAITMFKENMQIADVELPNDFGSEKLVGLMSLIHIYLKKGQTKVNDYPKSLFPILGITHFGLMFNMLPKDDKKPFTDDPQRFEDINLYAAKLAETGDIPLFEGGFNQQLTGMNLEESAETKSALNKIHRGAWLKNITQGKDILSNNNVNSQSALESMGRLGSGEWVGEGANGSSTYAPILELRRHVKGIIKLEKSKDWALDMYDFIVKLNKLETDRFELRRYELN